MALHPQASALLASIAAAPTTPLERMTVAEAREATALLADVTGEPAAVVAADDTAVPGPDGEVPVRVYRPAAEAGTPPLLVWFHGGGWVCGSIDQSDGTCRRLAAASGAVVVSVGYRLAPETPFPGGLEDCLAATRWCAEHATELGGDPDRLVVGGDSAGGNLAAAVALDARDRGNPRIALQVLVYPVTDGRCDLPSHRENGEGYLLSAAGMRWFWDHYVGQRADAREDPRASVLRAPDVAGLPPALVVTAEYDPLRDEGEAYARRLDEAGVATTCTRYDGMLHGFFGMGMLFDDAGRALDEVSAAVRSVSAPARLG